MTPPDSQPADGTGIYREPPRWWTLAAPCLLTLPVSAWCLLIAVLASASDEDGGACCGPLERWINPVAAAEFLLGATIFVTLTAGLAVPRWRRALRRVIWIACLLAWLGGGLVYYWASRTP